MSSFAPDPTPLEIDDVQHLRETAGEIRLRVSGRWRGEAPPSDAESALLVIQIEGRRHRFAPVSDGRAPSPGRWRASFVVPGWAEPRREGQAALWIGEAVVPIPPIGASRHWPGSGPPALGSVVPAGLPHVPAASGPQPSSASAPLVPVPAPPGHERAVSETTPEPPRSGPLAEMLLKETVAALHGELEARVAETTRLRSALAGAQSELKARGGSQTELEGTLGELGAELRRLTEAVEEQRRELDRRDTDGAREREEFERRVAELSVAREDQAAQLVAVRDGHAAELRELRAPLSAAQDSARRHAEENGALREELAAAQIAREAARSEAAGLRAELERLGGELAVTREYIDDQTGDLGEANRLLADARALAEQLRAGRTDPDSGSGRSQV